MTDAVVFLQLCVVRCSFRIASEGKVKAEELAKQLQGQLTELQQQLASQSVKLTNTTDSVSYRLKTHTSISKLSACQPSLELRRLLILHTRMWNCLGSCTQQSPNLT